MRVTRKQQIITLPGRRRKDIGIMLQRTLVAPGKIRRSAPLQIAAAHALRARNRARQIQHGIAEAQRLRLPAKEADSAPRAGSRSV